MCCIPYFFPKILDFLMLKTGSELYFIFHGCISFALTFSLFPKCKIFAKN